MLPDPQKIAERTAIVQEKIEQAAHRAGRRSEEITLVAVTKTWPSQLLINAYEAGLRHFGENRTHELTEKRPALERHLGPDRDEITWHFIGHLQTRQSIHVAEQADLFHAADRPKIVDRLARQTGQLKRPLPLLLEVNISGEESKSGFNCATWESDAAQQAAILVGAQAVQESEQLQLAGLMTMAPWGADPALIRSVFERTQNLRDWLKIELNADLPVLSMGMTDDFEIAIEAGATHIRVGRALFGERT